MQETIIFTYLTIGLFTGLFTFMENSSDHFILVFWKAIAAFFLWPLYHAAILLYILFEKLTSKN